MDEKTISQTEEAEEKKYIVSDYTLRRVATIKVATRLHTCLFTN